MTHMTMWRVVMDEIEFKQISKRISDALSHSVDLDTDDILSMMLQLINDLNSRVIEMQVDMPEMDDDDE